MSDLMSGRHDHGSRTSSCGTEQLRPRTDRPAIRRDRRWALVVGLWLCACVREVPTPIVAADRPQRWVDTSARPGGDGSRERPFKQVPAELPDRVELHLVSGVYEGPFVLPAGARLEGHGEVVLHAPAPTVVVAGEDVTLVHVSVQGGNVGLRAGGDVHLDRVHVSGHRQTGVEVLPGAHVDAQRLEVVGTIAESVGVQANQATVELSGGVFSGDLKRALEVKGGSVAARDTKSEGGNTLLNAQDASVTIERATATVGRGPAVFLSGGTARVEGLLVEGHEAALLAKGVTRLEVLHLRSRRPAWAGVVLQSTTGTLRDVNVTRAGPGGGVQAMDSDVTLEDVTVHQANAMGVFVRKGKAKLVRLTIEGVDGESDGAGGRALGDALMLRDAVVQVDEVTVRDVEGSAIYASAFADVTVGRLTCERSGGGLAFIERGAVVKARELTSRGSMGAAVLVPDTARLEVGTLVVRGAGEGPIFASCDGGASVVIGTLESTLEQPDSPCVTITTRRAPSP